MMAHFCISSIISNCDHFNLFYAVDCWITLGPGQSLKIPLHEKFQFKVFFWKYISNVGFKLLEKSIWFKKCISMYI